LMTFNPQKVKNIVTSIPMLAAVVAMMKLARALSKSPLKTTMVTFSFSVIVLSSETSFLSFLTSHSTASAIILEISIPQAAFLKRFVERFKAVESGGIFARTLIER
jgi:hypothetical protein